MDGNRPEPQRNVLLTDADKAEIVTEGSEPTVAETKADETQQVEHTPAGDEDAG